MKLSDYFMFSISLLLSFFMFFFNTRIAEGSIPSKKSIESQVINEVGAIQGGVAGKGFSLLDLQRIISNKEPKERIVLDIGDSFMKPWTGPIGYYHIELKKNPHQLIINLAQTLNSKMSEKAIEKKFKPEGIIQKGELHFDSFSQSTSLVLSLKKPIQVQVSQSKTQQKTNQLIIELFEPLSVVR